MRITCKHLDIQQLPRNTRPVSDASDKKDRQSGTETRDPCDHKGMFSTWFKELKQKTT